MLPSQIRQEILLGPADVDGVFISMEDFYQDAGLTTLDEITQLLVLLLQCYCLRSL